MIGYRIHTLTAITPSTGHSFPLLSLLAPANHHDSQYLKPLVGLAQALGIEMKLITADEAYNDNDGSLLAKRGVHLITPVSSGTSLPTNVAPDTLSVTCDDFCEIPMIRQGLTNEGHKYKCGAEPGQCPRATLCPGYRIVAFDNGHFQRIPIDCEEEKEAIDIWKNCERPFNLMKKREGLENARVRSQHALLGCVSFTTIAPLLIEMAGCRRKNDKKRPNQLELLDNVA